MADLVEKIALSHPEISIRLIQNGQNKLHTSGNHNLKDIIYTIFGREIAANLLPVEAGAAPVKVEGYIGKPLIARSNRNYENYFINGRYIKSGLVNKAIEDAYKPYMMQHKYPFTMLRFTIDPEFLDVNVHPAKMELRFRDGEMVYRMVYHTISMALSGKELIPQVELPQSIPEPGGQAGEGSNTPTASLKGLKPVVMKETRPEPFEIRRRNTELSNKTADPPKLTKEADAKSPAAARSALPQSPVAADPPGVYGAAPEQLNLFEEKLLTREARAEHILIGQLFDTYWLVQYHDNLYIIDQHAAHEKVLYEKTMASLKKREYASQLINPPIILTLSGREEVMLQKYMEHFTSIGFEIESFGGKEYAVRAVPANLFSIAKKELLMVMIDGLSDGIDQGTPDIINEKIASMSCKAAVKGNNAMTAAEAERLIDELLDLQNPYACPHGRPTIITMSKYELEKKFKRIV